MSPAPYNLLATDYIEEARMRLDFARHAMGAQRWNVVVRESQTTVEMALKGLLYRFDIEVPHIHNVEKIAEREAMRLPVSIRNHVPYFVKTSNELFKHRLDSLYGRDQSPASTLYTEQQAANFMAQAERVLALVEPCVRGQDGPSRIDDC